MNYLITEEFVKQTCPSISLNSNGITVQAALQMVTLRYMKKLLSTGLYGLYSDYVNADQPQSLTPAQAELFELVQLYMALQVERHMLTNLVEIGNKGTTAEATAASLEVVTFKRQELAASILAFEGDIQNYLAAHAQDFPEYTPPPGEAGPGRGPRTKNPFGISLEPDRPIVYR